MPTIYELDGFKFFFYANEHLPRHIHIKKGDEFAKYDLESEYFVINFFSSSDTKKLSKLLRKEQSYFMRRWDEFFAKS